MYRRVSIALLYATGLCSLHLLDIHARLSEDTDTCRLHKTKTRNKHEPILSSRSDTAIEVKIQTLVLAEHSTFA